MTQKETFVKIFRDFKKHIWKKKFIILLFWTFIISILDILSPFFYKEIIALIEKFIKTGYYNQEEIIKVFLYFAFFILFLTIIKAFVEYLLAKSNLKNYKMNHSKYSSKILKIDYASYLNEKSGSLFKIYDRWIEDQVELIYALLGEIIISVISVLFITILLLFINLKLAIATLAMIPFMIFVAIFFNLKTRKIQNKINDLRDKSFGILGDALNSMQLVKTLVLEKIFQKKLEKNIVLADQKQQEVVFRWIIADVLTSFFILISRILVLWLWFYLIINWEISFSILFLFFSFVGHIYFPIMWISKRLKIIQKKLQWIQRFYEKFDNLKIEKQEKSKEKLKNINWKIEYKNISFSYSKDKEVLKNINLKINPWEKIALVWNTWAGKSTIVHLLFKFWEPWSWEILIDWKNIKNLDKSFLRKNIWFVMQDNSLFNTTIKENLLYANKKASIKEIKKALENAQANFVFDLEKWLDTVIWERWLKLSWWEKQRISIARLFLKNPKILVLDEATSALDNKTEKQIQKALDKLMKWRTSIIIAHRLSTIENVDKIYFLENWQIVEFGTYQELINKKWKFYKLANPENLIIN